VLAGFAFFAGAAGCARLAFFDAGVVAGFLVAVAVLFMWRGWIA
jgi:hypothetical protein